MKVKSYAKLNLYLEVLNIRRDNYHNIVTLFERISLYDIITIKPRRDGKIRITCNNKSVPTDHANLAFRAASALREAAGINRGVDIAIDKRIPVAAGLGGGSSNAAATLLGLNSFWGLGFSRQKLILLASKLGCDVPFFLNNTSYGLGTERGDKIKALPAVKGKFWHILVAPKMPVSTPSVYKELDRQAKSVKKRPSAGLTKALNDVRILSLALKGGSTLKGALLFNRLEEATFKLYPQIKKIKDILSDSGCKFMLMSGSGPAVFGIVSSRKEGESLSRQLRRSGRWKCFVVRTI